VSLQAETVVGSVSYPESFDTGAAGLILEELRLFCRCPVTTSLLRPATAQELIDANGRAGEGQLWHKDGTAVRAEMRAGLVSEGGQFLYLFRDGIAFLMAGYAIDLTHQQAASQAAVLRPEKQNLQSFYDELGWVKGLDGDFEDALIYEDLRPVSADYIQKCHRRVKQFLAPAGRYLLDAASGPVQYQEYLEYSENYHRRVCVDLSFRALAEARRKLGNRGLYILADITNLPFVDGAMDGFVSLHTIYHVPADEQRNALLELFRVLGSGRSGVVVYQHRNGPLNRWVMGPPRLFKKLKDRAKLLRSGPSATAKPSPPPGQSRPQPRKPYSHFHPRKWFTSQQWEFSLEFRVWRSVSVPAMRIWIWPMLCGHLILGTLYRLEELFPNFFARIGEYPTLVIRRAS
jgi:SAM-dependent methyltransferase